MAEFSSRCPNQVLCMKPSRNTIVDGIVVQVPGEHIRFERGRYKTNDQKEVNFIRKHRLFENAIIEIKSSDKSASADKEE